MPLYWRQKGVKVTFIILSFLVLTFILVLAWCSYPWSLQKKVTKGELLRIETEGIVNNEEHPSVIKIQTWNLGFLFGEGSDGPLYSPKEKKFYEDKLNVLVSEITFSSPDIVCLQEIDIQSERSFNLNQAQVLARKANYPYIALAVGWESNYIPFPYWPLSRNFGRVKSGGAILSRYPITSQEVTLLQKPMSQPWWYNLFYPHRYFQKVEIDLGSKKISLINLHLEAYDKLDRQDQVRQLVEKIKQEKIDFVAGDFNMLPPSASKKSKFVTNKDEYENDSSYQEMVKSNLLEVIPDEIYALDEASYLTFPASRPERRLDYIFYQAGLKMIKAEILPSALSDHLPLKSTFQISNPNFNPYSQ